MGECLVDPMGGWEGGAYCWVLLFPAHTHRVKLGIHITHSELSWSSLGKARVL